MVCLYRIFDLYYFYFKVCVSRGMGFRFEVTTQPMYLITFIWIRIVFTGLYYISVLGRNLGLGDCVTLRINESCVTRVKPNQSTLTE